MAYIYINVLGWNNPLDPITLWFIQGCHLAGCSILAGRISPPGRACFLWRETGIEKGVLVCDPVTYPKRALKYPVTNSCFLVPLLGGRYHIIPQLAVYTTYILPIGWLYITYHLLREPETAIDVRFGVKRYPRTYSKTTTLQKGAVSIRVWCLHQL